MVSLPSKFCYLMRYDCSGDRVSIGEDNVVNVGLAGDDSGADIEGGRWGIEIGHSRSLDDCVALHDARC